MSIFSMFFVIELKLFQEFLKPKEKFYEDEELHLIKITKNDYEYCYCNFLKSNIVINKENPMIDQYLKDFQTLELRMMEVIKKIFEKLGINIEEVESYDYLVDSIKHQNSANIERYMIKVFEGGMLSYSKEDLNEALEEFLVAKYLYETVIFIRMISSDKSETIPFIKLLECIENEDELNLFSENKIKKIHEINIENLIIFTFLGGIIKTFKNLKVMEEDIQTESLIKNSNEAFTSLIKFYPEIIKLVIECSKAV
jgi:hypothetical protein